MSQQPDPYPEPGFCEKLFCRDTAFLPKGEISKDRFGTAAFCEYVEFYQKQFRDHQRLYVTPPLPTLNEARGILIGAAESEKRPDVVISVFCCDEEGMTKEGEDTLSILVTAQKMGAAALVVSCGEEGRLPDILSRLLPYARIPVGGEIGREEEKEGLANSGASFCLIGGKIEPVGGSVRPAPAVLSEDELLVSTRRGIHFLSLGFDMSPPLLCSADMSQQIMEIENEGYSVIQIEIQSQEDLDYFYDNSYMFNLPVCAEASDFDLLEGAARCFGGQLLVMDHGDFEKESLLSLSCKYGAIIL